MDIGLVALAVGALLTAGIGASLLAGRLRLPGLVLVLVLGMVIGSDGLEWINFGANDADYDVAQNAAIMALALILYEGGLSSGWAEIKPAIGVSVLLATVGTALTAGLTAVAAALLFSELSALEALILGSTVAATDAAAVFAVLRGSTLRRRIARTLEGESGVNDPIAVLLVLASIEAINHADFGLLDALWLGVSELAIGAVVGLAIGGFGVWVLQHVTLPSAGLYPVASVAFAAMAYGGADTLHGTGFLAVFIAGLVIGSATSPARRTIITFHEGLAWVAQLALFLLLGLLVNPGDLLEIIPEGTAIAIVTALLARPLAALIVAYGFTLPERLMLGWAGLRGATPIVFATFPVTEGIPNGHLIFQVAFFVVLLSTVLQGLTIEPVAGWLRVTSDAAAIPAPLVEPVLLNRLGAETMQFPVRPQRRDRRPPGPRARAPARGAPERDRPRRARDPAARVHGHPGRRPAPHPRPPGGRGRVPRPDAPLALRPDRARSAPAAPSSQPSLGHLDPPLAARGRRPPAPEGARRPRGHRAVAHAARRAGRAGRSGGRPLRRLGPAGRGRPVRRAAGVRPPPPGQRRLTRRARLVAGGRGRARALT